MELTNGRDDEWIYREGDNSYGYGWEEEIELEVRARKEINKLQQIQEENYIAIVRG